MPKSSWIETLLDILLELTDDQLRRMLLHLDKIPQSQRKNSREDMAELIVQHYGETKSISVIKDVMKKIPRNDPVILELLRPFMDKRKREREAAPDQPLSSKPERVDDSQTCRKSIREFKDGRRLDQKFVMAKVVHKSALLEYRTKDERRKAFFLLGVADETASMKVMVYGEERYKEIMEGSCWLFREVLLEGDCMKVTKKSCLAKVGPLCVPDELELEARTLVNPHGRIRSIMEVRTSAEKTTVCVRGTVREIGCPTPYDSGKKKKEKQDFQLADGSESIWISLWDGHVRRLQGISVGDLVEVTNVRTSIFGGTVSLNSTDYTRISKLQSAAVQIVRVQIRGVVKADETETRLEAQVDDRMETFDVASKHLAKAIGVKLGGDFEKKILENIPLEAEVEIQGRKMNKIVKLS